MTMTVEQSGVVREIGPTGKVTLQLPGLDIEFQAQSLDTGKGLAFEYLHKSFRSDREVKDLLSWGIMLPGGYTEVNGTIFRAT